MHLKVLGTGSYLPERKVTNQQLVQDGLDTTDDWIVSHTGIKSRQVAAPDEATSDLAVRAAERALKAANLDAQQLGFIVCATSTPDHTLPATANLIQAALGANCGAMDLNAGCSGFVQALAVGFALCNQSEGRPVLVVGADCYSRIMDWSDRTTAVFFGDGAGAVVIAAGGTRPTLLSVMSGSDGKGGKQIIVESGGSRCPVTPLALEEGKTKLRMNGRAVWDFALDKVPALIREVVAQAGLTLAEIDLIIPHQSNAKMLNAFAEALDISQEKIFFNVQNYANTAAASVAIALDEAVRQKRLQPGGKVVLVGFGAGLSWCAACLSW